MCRFLLTSTDPTDPRIAIVIRPCSRPRPDLSPHPPQDCTSRLPYSMNVEPRGADIPYVTLHVGLGTFQPLHTDVVEQAHLHSKHYEVEEASARRIRDATRRIAVGTTSARTLETVARAGSIEAATGDTDIFIYPGFQFRAVDAMLTNFHLPQSSLLLLVSAFAGKDLILSAYEHAVAERYRFFSYGDCMLIL